MDMPEQSVDMVNPVSDSPSANIAEITVTEQPNDNNQKAETLSKDEIIVRLSEISEAAADDISRDDVAHLKQQFYAIRREETATEKQDYVNAGNDINQFAPQPDPAEEKLKEILNIIKEKKAEQLRQIEARQQANFEQKSALVDEIASMSADTDNVNRHFTRFKEIQQQYKEIGEVPAPMATDLWKKYQDAVEKFYDQLKINKDLRDYDFKKNLESKELLCEQAEKLSEENDIITAFRRLQELHDKWREIGPVAKENRDEIWTRFKDASAIINKRYQTFFEERKQREQFNEEAKTAICEELDALDFSTLKSYAAWDEMTKTILDAQTRWKKLGFASKKNNNALYERYRAICDKFFAEKAAYYKSVKEDHETNLKKKTELCEKAEALMESDDWKATTDTLIELQKQWKTIGTVPKKHSDAIWKRFQQACDTFFDRKKKAGSSTRQIEVANLKAKKAIIASLAAITPETPRDEAIKTVKDAIAQWGQIGHVPFREKDKIYENYRKLVDELYDRLDIRENKAGMARFESTIADLKSDTNKLYRERERLVRAYEAKNSELTTCENNMGFFTSKSKSGDSMLREMQRRVQRIKEDIANLEQKIKIIDGNLA